MYQPATRIFKKLYDCYTRYKLSTIGEKPNIFKILFAMQLLN